ncbi:MAG: CsiV family protein [Gammaproteobacteria bacterium]|nr:CsiV family protein [Gammaproteobacteria bacterium]MDP6535588.1 CsiV family protein [Gammaproteobacteria bacterium]MDP6731793.1 CsiV family protein [Gammaproteobacteria bacterium]
MSMQVFRTTQSIAAITTRLSTLCSCKPGLSLAVFASLLLISDEAAAQDRWFQIEVSVFSNESPDDRAQERWQAERLDLAYPENMRRLDLLWDLLLTESLRQAESPGIEIATEQVLSATELAEAQRSAAILATGPRAAQTAGEFRFFDLARDDYVQLPPSDSDFQQTNRVLQRSAGHRLLFHGLWRQVVTGATQAEPVYVQGGLAYGEHHELEGSLTIRFNENQDRVVVDADLWLNEFSIVEDPDNDWDLPAIPAVIADPQGNDATGGPALIYHPIKTYHMQQGREMRSTEFHYLDHPALGIVILVVPYELPDLPQPESDFELDR